MKDRMNYKGPQAFADGHFGKGETAIGAVASYLTFWYSNDPKEILEAMKVALDGSFVAVSRINPNETLFLQYHEGEWYTQLKETGGN